MKTYGTRSCHICGIPVTTSGQGRAAHMKRHVREGRAIGLLYISSEGRGFLNPVQYVSAEEGTKLLREFPYVEGIAGYVKA